jgi:FAD/FMN-containing dehydrogenase
MTDNLSCNDVHSRLNPVRVAEVRCPLNLEEVREALREATTEGRAVSICGCRHAMGGQQFGEGTLLLDLTGLKALGSVDKENRWVEAGAGLTWPELQSGLLAKQQDEPVVLSFRQKQTGADGLSLGGALAANIHGRGLEMRPIVEDVEAFTLIDADGQELRCSRLENVEWFGLVIGGYGCFGVITSVCLRLVERTKVERRVTVLEIDEMLPALEQRIREGCRYGDFQFSIDEGSIDFLKRGVLSSYRPVDASRPMLPGKELGVEDWRDLIDLAHTDRAKAFQKYAEHYLSTNGALYWSDTHQMSVYLDDYHRDLETRLGTPEATEVISELYVPRNCLVPFMAIVAEELRGRAVPVIYGTVRLIRRDEETSLAWARDDFACVIFNLHVEHSAEGRERAAEAFRMLIDVALSYDGSYFLTYHRWARRDQVERAYPQFAAFLAAKDRLDPEQRFQSEWWRHYRALFQQV